MAHHPRVLLLLLAIVSSAPFSARAEFTSFTDLSAWQAALSAEQVETLDGAPGGFLTPGVPLDVGALSLVADDATIIGATNKILFASLFAPPTSRTLTIDFETPISAFGADFLQAQTGAATRLTIAGESVIPGDEPGFTGAGISERGFFGVISDIPFSSVHFDVEERAGQITVTPGLDDIRFSSDFANGVLLAEGQVLVTDTLGRNLSGQTDGSLELLVPLPDSTRVWEGGNFERPFDLVVSSDERVFFVGEGQGGSIWELDLTTGVESLVVNATAFLAGTQFGPIAVAPGGDLLMAARRGNAGKIVRFDPDNPQPVEIGGLSSPLDLEDLVTTSDGRVFVSGDAIVVSMNENSVVGALYELNPVSGALTLVSVGQRITSLGTEDREKIGNFAQGLAVDALDRILISTGYASTGCGLECSRWVVRYDPTTTLTEKMFDGGGSTLAVLPDGEVIFAGGGAGVARFDSNLSQVVSHFSSPQPDSLLTGLWVMEQSLLLTPAPEPTSGLGFGIMLLCTLRRRARRASDASHAPSILGTLP